MLDYGNNDNNTFALRALPDYSQLQWGTGSLIPKDGNVRYLCFNGQPVNVWIIGELRGFRTKDYKFKPYIYNANRVVVGAVPFHSLDRYLAQKTLGFFSMPPMYTGTLPRVDKSDQVFTGYVDAPTEGNMPANQGPSDGIVLGRELDVRIRCRSGRRKY